MAPAAKPLWLRIVQFPLTRLLVLGAAILVLMAVNGGFLETIEPSRCWPLPSPSACWDWR
jgi:hypothetical protein